jgi:sulfide:quinone oxidoreductase
MAEPGSPAEVLVVGGGVAALETLMALHDLAGDRVRVTLVAPDPDFVYRPMAVAEPFGLAEARRYPLRRIVDDFGAALVQAGVSGLDAAARRVVLRSGDTMPYDTLVLAPGARMLPAFDDAVTFRGPGSGAAMRALLDELEQGRVRRIAFVAPTVVGWTLPLYELALLTARHAAARNLERELVLVTPEQRPLTLFGDRPSAAVAELLAAAGVEFIGASHVEVADGAARLFPGGRALGAERVVALPLMRGPRIDGVPAEPDFGFIPVDRHGRVDGLEGVYAAGDATHFPVKQGGLAAQQADAVAEHVAARHGVRLEPSPFRPVLRGLLFAGGPDRYLRAVEPGEGAAAAQALWWPPTKIAGRHLAPYLYVLEPDAQPARAPAGFADFEVALETVESTPAGR